MKSLLALAIIFLLGMTTFWSAVWFFDVHTISFAAFSGVAGISALLAAVIIYKPYTQALRHRRSTQLYFWVVMGVLLSHLLFGIVAGLSEASPLFSDSQLRLKEFVELSILLSFGSLLLGFLQNMLFGIAFSMLLWRWTRPASEPLTEPAV